MLGAQRVLRQTGPKAPDHLVLVNEIRDLFNFMENIIAAHNSLHCARHLEVRQIGPLKKVQIKERNTRVKNLGHQNSSLQMLK